MDTDVSKLVAAYRQLRDKKGQIEAAVKARVAPIAKKMEEIEIYLLELSKKQGVDSFKTSEGTVYKYKSSSVRMSDWPIFLGFVKENDGWELLTRGASKNEVIALFESGTAVPGIEIFNEFKMGFRAPSK
jgi:hypothetical protein